MKVVIEIPDEIYGVVQECEAHSERYCMDVTCGTPIPKGHGKIIDADWFKRYLWSCSQSHKSEGVEGDCFTWKDIKAAIEAAPDFAEEWEEDD